MRLSYGFKKLDDNGYIAELIGIDKRGYFATDLNLEQNEEEIRQLDGNLRQEFCKLIETLPMPELIMRK